MTRRNWREHLPLWRPLLLLLGLLALLCAGLARYGEFAEKPLDDRAWQRAAAGSFADAAPPAAGWTPGPAAPGAAGFASGSGAYWLRVPLPASASRQPRLWIVGAEAIRVLGADGSELYRYDPLERRDRLNPYMHWILVRLPLPLPPRVDVLVERRFSSYEPVPTIRLVDEGDLVAELFRRDSYSFVLAGLHFFCAIIALGLFASRREKLYLYFFLLAACGTYSSAVRNSLLQLFLDEPWLGYLQNAVFPLGVFAFIGTLYELLRPHGRAVLNALRRSMLAFAAVSAAAALLSPSLYDWLLRYPLPPFYLISAALLFRTLRSAYLRRRDLESVWLLAGSFSLSSVATFHVLRFFAPGFYDELARRLPILSRMPENLLSLGMFLFMISLIRVIVHRFGSLNRQLTQFNQTLEDNVRSRTAELHERTVQLQETSDRLAASMLETAEVMAESLVLEERHRITGSIHDNVAHVLAATVVELDEADRLLAADPEGAAAKVGSSQQRIRQGLEEIRRSVRMLKEDATHYDLPAAMGALIRDATESAGVVVDAEVGPLPGSMTMLQKRVLFRALQEGLAIGIRQGGARRFRLSLGAAEERLRFELQCDGTVMTPDGDGFGLRALADDVSRLSGRLHADKGSLGCALRIELPYAPESTATMDRPTWQRLGGE